MPYRPPFDPAEVARRTELEHDRRHREDQAFERAAMHDPSSWTGVPLCAMCGRVLIAQETCAACGDSDETDVAA